jgi:hypothetical protein
MPPRLTLGLVLVRIALPASQLLLNQFSQLELCHCWGRDTRRGYIPTFEHQPWECSGLDILFGISGPHLGCLIIGSWQLVPPHLPVCEMHHEGHIPLCIHLVFKRYTVVYFMIDPYFLLYVFWGFGSPVIRLLGVWFLVFHLSSVNRKWYKPSWCLILRIEQFKFRDIVVLTCQMIQM